MTPEQIFKYHYGDIKDPATPIVIQYGGLTDDICWGLSRNDEATLFGVPYLQNDEAGTTSRFLGMSGSFGTEQEARHYIQRIHYKMTSLLRS